jgi:hypothetical protein
MTSEEIQERRMVTFLGTFFVVLILSVPISVVTLTTKHFRKECAQVCSPHEGAVWRHDCYCKVDGELRLVDGSSP